MVFPGQEQQLKQNLPRITRHCNLLQAFQLVRCMPCVLQRLLLGSDRDKGPTPFLCLLPSCSWPETTAEQYPPELCHR